MAHVDSTRRKDRAGILAGSFWLDVLERAVKSAAQAVGALYTTDAVFDIFTFNWANAGKLAANMAALSILTSLGSAPFGDKSSAGLLR